MIYIKLITIVICAGLNVLGGYSWHNARRFIMPVVIAAAICIALHSLVGLTCLLAIAPLCTGYGDKSPIKHIFGDAWGRFIWMILVSIALCMGVLILHHLNVFIGVGYVLFNGMLGITLRKYDQILIDAVFGIGFSSMLLFIH